MLVVIRDAKDWIRFAMFDFAESDVDCKDVRYFMIFHGEGPSDGLRECRHIWWGDGEGDERGYTFYLPLAETAEALTLLRRWFD